MKTFKQEITVSDELVQMFAIFLGYQPKITEYPELTEIDNPESAEEYVDKMAKTHTQAFLKPFANFLVGEEIAKLNIEQAKKQIEDAIVTPVMESLTTSFE